MAKLYEMGAEEEAGWLAWVKARPPVVREIVERRGFRPDTLYRLKTTGQRGLIYSVSEGGTVTMEFPGKFNVLAGIGINVFGIQPDDIEECDDLRTGVESFKPLPEKRHV